MTQCLHCSKLDLRKHPRHAVSGIGKCEHEGLAGTFVSFAYRRECAQYQQAAEEVVAARVKWWNDQSTNERK